jgi:hypothetical protein
VESSSPISHAPFLGSEFPDFSTEQGVDRFARASRLTT